MAPADGDDGVDDCDKTEPDRMSVDSAVPSSAASAAAASSNASREEAETIRRQLLDAVSRDDVDGVQRQCERVAELGLSLTDAELRDPDDRSTVLHTALLDERWNVAEHLIRWATDERLLAEVYDVTGRLSLMR